MEDTFSQKQAIFSSITLSFNLELQKKVQCIEMNVKLSRTLTQIEINALRII